jgi:hypothetical protein
MHVSDVDVLGRRRFILGLLATASLALVLRALPLCWSPHVATLDGFTHVADAEATMVSGSISPSPTWIG